MLSPSDIFSLYRPSRCERRVFLRAHGEPEGEPGDFDRLMEELGQRHENNHLATFPEVLNLSKGHLRERARRTAEAMKKSVPVIYQGVLISETPELGDSVVGIPDFLIWEGPDYRIRDCKLSRHVGNGRHEEIVLQLQLYGWLYEQNLHRPPSALEVYLGDQSVIRLPYDGGADAMALLKKIVELSHRADEPYSPVGWSKCLSCGFRDRCWNIAKKMNDVALVYELDQGTAVALRDQGITTIDQLLKNYTADRLAELRKPHGKHMVRVGVAATRILLQAEALRSLKEKLLKPLVLPANDNLVMFDLEGLPPQFDELDKVYLWGMQVYGRRPGSYLPALAGFGEEGDREGWGKFLENASSLFGEYGDLPFVHWHNYETTKIKTYLRRYGDREGVGERVLQNCVDLLRITRDALVLPEYSYGLKVIEKHAGFRRSMQEFGGDWSIVQYIRAVETHDHKLRDKIMSEILKYNEEDLTATWAVFQWLKKYKVE